MSSDPYDPRPVQVQFLQALAKFEERTKDGKNRIDVEPGFVDEVVKEVWVPLRKLLHARVYALQCCEKGVGRYKPKSLRAAIMEKCRQDPVYWINHWTYIQNPHITKYGFPVRLPFILFPKQEEYIRWREDLYHRNRSGLVFKCRDMGVSWMNVTIHCWHLLFEKGFQGRIGSLKAEEVDDKDDPDSLFQKLRFVLYNTPYWMRPKELWYEGNRYDTKMKLVNPTNGATISGQQGENMGRGGRAGLFDIDEWAKIEHDRAVDTNLSRNTPCRIYTGTPMGRDNDYAEKYHSGRLPVFSFDYWDDPRKTPDWFTNQTERESEEAVQQEILKSFDAFKGGTAIPTVWVNAAVSLYERIASGDIAYTPSKTTAGLDVAAGGRNRTVLVVRKGIILDSAQEWNLDNPTYILREAGSVCEVEGVDTLNYDPISIGWGITDAASREGDKYSFQIVPADYRGAASEIPIEGDTKPARERCANRRAELMMRMRRRFECTYEFVAKGVDHPLENMVAVCKNQRLINQLSVPERFNQHGKWRLQPKEEMVRRGVESVDYFDAAMLTEADEIMETRVVQKFNPRREGLVEKDIPIQSLVGRVDSLHYISVYHTRALSVGVVGVVWNGQRLVVYRDWSCHNATVAQVVNVLTKLFPRPRDYVGNKEMFQEGSDDLFMEYLARGITMIENYLYNDLSSVSTLNQLVEFNQLRIGQSCKTLINQLQGFDRAKGVPDKTNMEVALALMNALNRLEEVGVTLKPVVQPVHYRRRESRGVSGSAYVEVERMMR